MDRVQSSRPFGHVNIISFKSSGTDTTSFGPKDAEVINLVFSMSFCPIILPTGTFDRHFHLLGFYLFSHVLDTVFHMTKCSILFTFL